MASKTIGARKVGGGSADIRPNGSRWRKFRLTILDRFPLCVYCLHQGLVTKSNVVDHVIPLCLGGSSLEHNLIGACRECNEEKRHAEQAWLSAGHPLVALETAAPVRGTLKWWTRVAATARDAAREGRGADFLNESAVPGTRPKSIFTRTI